MFKEVWHLECKMKQLPVVTFHDTFVYEFCLERLEGGELDHWLDYDDYDWPAVMVWLLAHPTAWEQYDCWKFTEKEEIGYMIAGFIDTVIYPNLSFAGCLADPDASVAVTFHLSTEVDLFEKYAPAAGADWWTQGDCLDTHREAFRAYLLEAAPEEEADLLDDLWLDTTWCDCADLNQWRLLNSLYAAFLEDMVCGTCGAQREVDCACDEEED